jgi:pyrimidine-nucleoside phosphorylase
LTAQEIIAKKRDGHELSEAEIDFFINGYVRRAIPDYQTAALLMAIYFRGMSFQETVTLTRLMRDSGDVVDLSAVPGLKIDKHSTGGVGDKISLILAPLVAAAGVPVPMISGRSLAHTGGTLDKLESIPGFRTNLTLRQFAQHLKRNKACLIGQTRALCPADRLIYALRDATGTVPSLPLICASILSKKLAEGINALVVDVKIGNGAIFEQDKEGEDLAQQLIRVASEFHLPTVALLTDMSQPLGRAVGNWLEVLEGIEVLRGSGPDDVRELTLALAAYMLYMGKGAESIRQGYARARRALESGDAWKQFVEIVQAQGGDLKFVQKPERYPKPKHRRQIHANATGWIAAINARRLGQIAMALGAGRRKLKDAIDYTAGLYVEKKVGDAVAAGEPLLRAQSSRMKISDELAADLRGSFMINRHHVQPSALIRGVLDANGLHPAPEFS